MSNDRVMSSEYMHWAKTRSHAKFNLANSGVIGYPLAELPVKIEDLEINGPSYYGYEPLQKALAAKCGATTDNVVAANGASMANFLVQAAALTRKFAIDAPFAATTLSVVAPHLAARAFCNGS